MSAERCSPKCAIPDPNAALRESALPTLLTYTGHEGILSDTTQAETIAAVESLPDGRAVLEPFAEGNHNLSIRGRRHRRRAGQSAAGDDSGVFGGVFEVGPPRLRSRQERAPDEAL